MESPEAAPVLVLPGLDSAIKPALWLCTYAQRRLKYRFPVRIFATTWKVPANYVIFIGFPTRWAFVTSAPCNAPHDQRISGRNLRTVLSTSRTGQKSDC
jgi:hypothetical protein